MPTAPRAKTLLILGATGLVGQQLLAQALAHPGVAKVVAPTRRALGHHPKLNNPVVDFATLPAAAWWKADAALCALGTTLKQAGSQADFQAVDHHLVLAAARAAKAAGTPAWVLNSSLGADAHSGSFYLRVKGQAEEALIALDFASLTLVRPALLDGGPRTQARPAETLGLWLVKAVAPVVPTRYRAVTTQAVARTMLECALAAKPGCARIESDQI